MYQSVGCAGRQKISGRENWLARDYNGMDKSKNITVVKKSGIFEYRKIFIVALLIQYVSRQDSLRLILGSKKSLAH